MKMKENGEKKANERSEMKLGLVLIRKHQC